MKLFGLLLLFVLLEPALIAQTRAPNQFTRGCTESESKAILPPTDAVYSDAMDLARLLTGRGIRVDCICASKGQRFFDGQKGAAYFHTESGIFDSLYLPKGKVFRIDVVEKDVNGCKVYSFRGSPVGHPINSCGRARPIVFIQHKNVLLLVDGGSGAGQLRKALKSR